MYYVWFLRVSMVLWIVWFVLTIDSNDWSIESHGPLWVVAIFLCACINWFVGTVAYTILVSKAERGGLIGWLPTGEGYLSIGASLTILILARIASWDSQLLLLLLILAGLASAWVAAEKQYRRELARKRAARD